MIQMNKESVYRLLGIGVGKRVGNWMQEDAPPEEGQTQNVSIGVPKSKRSPRRLGNWMAAFVGMAGLLGTGTTFAQSVNTGSAVEFAATTYGTESDAETVSLEFTDIPDGSPVAAFVTNTDFEISADGSTWGTSASLSVANPTTDFYVRVRAGAYAQTKTEVPAVYFEYDSAPLEDSLLVSFTVNKAPLTITAFDTVNCNYLNYSGTTTGTNGFVIVPGLYVDDQIESIQWTIGNYVGDTGTVVIDTVILSSSTVAIDSNYSVTYINGYAANNLSIEGAVIGAANLVICHGSSASINVNIDDGGKKPTNTEPFKGVFKIINNGTGSIKYDTFLIKSSPFAVTVASSLLPAVDAAAEYTISLVYLENPEGCYTSDPDDLTGDVDITVNRTPTLNVVETPASNSISCGTLTPSFLVTNPNSLSGSYYDIAVNYGGITGGIYTSTWSELPFSATIPRVDSMLTNGGSNLDSVSYIITAVRPAPGSGIFCKSSPQLVKYYIKPDVTFAAVTATDTAVCSDDLSGVTFSITGLVPNTDHDIVFDITGDDNNLGQTYTATSDSDGNIDFTANDFNNGEPAPGTYTFSLRGLEANGCPVDLSTAADTSITVVILPKIDFDSVYASSSVVCHNELDSTVVTISGLAPNSDFTFTFDITGDDENLGQVAERTSDASGNVTFTAAEFNDGDPAVGSYTFTLKEIQLGNCSIEIEARNEVNIEILPTPTFDSLTKSADVVCQNDLGAESMTIHGLLPSANHTITFTVEGESESGDPQTFTTTSCPLGTITVTAEEFNNGNPAPGTYTLTVTKIEVEGCELTVSANNAQEITIAPTPSVTGVELVGGCFTDDSLTITFSGLLPNTTSTVYGFRTWYDSDLSVWVGPYSDSVVLTADANGDAEYAISVAELPDEQNLQIALTVNSVRTGTCYHVLSQELADTLTFYGEPEVTDFTATATPVCVGEREDLEFNVESTFLANVTYSLEFKVTKGTVIDTIIKVFNNPTETTDYTFYGDDLTGSDIIPGNYTIELISITQADCKRSFDAGTHSAVFELSGMPVVSLTQDVDTLYIGANCSTIMPDYISTHLIVSGGCIPYDSAVQLGENKIGATVEGHGGYRNVVIEVTTSVPNGGTVVVYDTLKLYLIDSLKPVIQEYSDYTVYLSNEGVALLNATDIDSASFDNCTLDEDLEILITKGNTGTPSPSITFECWEVGDTTVTLHVKDESNNVATKTMTVHVVDTIRPLITVAPSASFPDTILLQKGPNCTNKLGDYTYLHTSLSITDNCSDGDFTYTQFPDSSHIYAKSVNFGRVWLYAADASGNKDSISFVLRFIDTVAPVFAGVPTEAITDTIVGSACSKNITLPVITAMDACSDTSATITYTRSDGAAKTAPFAIGSTWVYLSASDVKGNVALDSYQVIISPVFATPTITLSEDEFVLYLNEESCSAPVPAWPTTSIGATSIICEDAEITVDSVWYLLVENVITPIDPTTYVFTQTGHDSMITVYYSEFYNFGGTLDTATASFTVKVLDTFALKLEEIADITINVNTFGCIATVNPEDFAVPVNTCGSPLKMTDWHIEEIIGADTVDFDSGLGDIANCSAKTFDVGTYLVTYHLENLTGVEDSIKYLLEIAKPLDGYIEGPGGSVIQQDFSTSVVKFTGSFGRAPYTFTYDVYKNDTIILSDQVIETDPGSDIVVYAHDNSVLGVFKYKLKSVTDSLGCTVELDDSTVVTVRLANGVDLTMNVFLLPNTLKANGTLKDVHFDIRNIGEEATSGPIEFRVFKPRISGTNSISVPEGWEVVDSNVTSWLVRSVDEVIIESKATKRVTCQISYSGTDKGNASMSARLTNETGGDTKNSNNGFSRQISIN
jgi:hypothetical protein